MKREAVRFRLEGKEEAEVPSPALASPEDDTLRYLAAVVRGEVRPSGLSSLENNLVVTEDGPEIYTTFPFEKRLIDKVHPLDTTTART